MINGENNYSPKRTIVTDHFVLQKLLVCLTNVLCILAKKIKCSVNQSKENNILTTNMPSVLLVRTVQLSRRLYRSRSTIKNFAR